MRHESANAGWHYGESISTIELARVLFLTGDTKAAAETLVPVLLVGAQAGLVRTIVDAGPEILKIIAELRDASRSHRWPANVRQVPADYLWQLLATAHADAKNAAIPVIARASDRTPTPEEPLSARELEVLRLLDRGLSNKQIARNLGVTVNTVKWYLKGIYINWAPPGAGNRSPRPGDGICWPSRGPTRLDHGLSRLSVVLATVG